MQEFDRPSAPEPGVSHRRVDTPTAGSIKIKVLRRAGDEIGTPLDVEGHRGIPSGVPEQPFSVQLGFSGGANRLEGLDTPHEPVAIENFTEQVSIVGPDAVMWNGTMIHDIGAVVGKNPDGSYRIASSSGVRFPQRFYHEANRRGFARHTVGEVLAEDAALTAMGVAKDPHQYYTKGAYRREDFLTVPASLILMNDKETQGPKIENNIRERIRNSEVRLPGDVKILSTSTQGLKNAAINNVLTMINASSATVESYDGTTPADSRQIMSLNDGFQTAYSRIETIHRDLRVPRTPGDVTLSIQSCLIPVVLDAELRFFDAATVLIEKINEDGSPSYYSSVSAGTEFPAEYVRLAVLEDVTTGKKMKEMLNFDPADPQKSLYNVSRQVLLEEAVFIASAQMQSGLEIS
ncbi:MAG: hypothetical protein AAB553_06120 [Patescibacteria group bacterium]